MIKLVSDTIDKADIKALTEWLNQDEIPRLTKGEITWLSHSVKALISALSIVSLTNFIII